MNERRTAVVVTDGEKVLICHAPNRKHEANSWDLPKGHCDGDEDYFKCGLRELYEETNLLIEDMTENGVSAPSYHMSEEFPYRKDKMCVLFLKVSKIPEKELKCVSTFEWKGDLFPEVNEYDWVDVSELKDKLYKSHVNTTIPVIEEYFNEIMR